MAIRLSSAEVSGLEQANTVLLAPSPTTTATRGVALQLAPLRRVRARRIFLCASPPWRDNECRKSGNHEGAPNAFAATVCRPLSQWISPMSAQSASCGGKARRQLTCARRALSRLLDRVHTSTRSQSNRGAQHVHRIRRLNGLIAIGVTTGINRGAGRERAN
jgi:hypothetical protein